MTIHLGKNTCAFCGHVDKRHDEMNYCSQCGRLGHALYRKCFNTEEGRAALAKVVPGLSEHQLHESSIADAVVRILVPTKGE